MDHQKKLNLQQAFLLTALSWLGIAIFGSLPFIFSSLELSIMMLFLKACQLQQQLYNYNKSGRKSGYPCMESDFTSCGGIGIIIAITLMPIMNVGGMQLFKISSNDASEKYYLNQKKYHKTNYNLFYFNFLCILLQIFWNEFFDSLTFNDYNCYRPFFN